MSGRRGARALALQAIAVNVAFVAVDYAAAHAARPCGLRSRRSRATGDDHPDTPDVAAFANRAVGWWMERSFAMFHVLMLAAGALALSRPRAKLFFEASARAADRAEEEP